MERVQFEQEGMVVELKDLLQKGLFTDSEAKQIMRKRTAFETALVRRVAKKSDFLHYIAFESGLDALTRKRMKRLKIPDGCFYFTKRQNAIFERAVKKFKSDVGIWVEYIEHAKRQGAHVLVGRIATRALHMHPTKPPLYIILAAHEMEVNHSPDAARKVLQRGLRINDESGSLWVEYVKMEMWYAEVVRRRRGVLGIDGAVKEDEENEEDGKQVDHGPEGDQALVEVIKVVIRAALTKLNEEWIEKLRSTVQNYPVPDSVRDRLLVLFE